VDESGPLTTEDLIQVKMKTNLKALKMTNAGSKSSRQWWMKENTGQNQRLHRETKSRSIFEK
jgi:hypothetical protein